MSNKKIELLSTRPAGYKNTEGQDVHWLNSGPPGHRIARGIVGTDIQIVDKLNGVIDAVNELNNQLHWHDPDNVSIMVGQYKRSDSDEYLQDVCRACCSDCSRRHEGTEKISAESIAMTSVLTVDQAQEIMAITGKEEDTVAAVNAIAHGMPFSTVYSKICMSTFNFKAWKQHESDPDENMVYVPNGSSVVTDCCGVCASFFEINATAACFKRQTKMGPEGFYQLRYKHSCEDFQLKKELAE